MLIQVRRDTAANWTSRNPTLAQGEPGYDLTNAVLKFGDGITPWNTLAAFTAGGTYSAFTDVASLGGNVVQGTPHLQTRTEPGSVVRLQGQIGSSTSSTGTLFTLPAGQLPAAAAIIGLRSSGASPAQFLLTFNTDGTVTTGAALSVGNFLNLDGVTLVHA